VNSKLPLITLNFFLVHVLIEEWIDTVLSLAFLNHRRAPGCEYINIC